MITSSRRTEVLKASDCPQFHKGVFGISVMGLRLQVEIKESQEELETDVKYTAEASSKERLQMLYWLKTGQVTSRRSLAERLGRDAATITRWLKKYKDGGYKGLLEVKQAPGKEPIVRGEHLERLKLTAHFNIMRYSNNNLRTSFLNAWDSPNQVQF